MIRYDCKQGSTEWNRLRAGIPTASDFDKIITPEGKISRQRDGYLRQLIAERLGVSFDSISTAAMDAGRMMEPDAVRWYEFTREVTTEVVGFCTLENGIAGASPDRFVGEDGLLEIKCPLPKTHIGYLLDPKHAGAYPDYKVQVQGQLWVTGRKWCDVVSYSLDLPPLCVRVERDEIFIGLLELQVRLLAADVLNGTEQIREMPGFVEVAA